MAGFAKRVIDVSVYQGDIDWSAVKLTDVYAAILRAGYGRYDFQKDVKFDRNMSNCEALDIPYGVYWYSYATTPDEAKQEADVCLRVIENASLSMPVYFDQEDSSIPVANRTGCAVAFADRIRASRKCVIGYYSYTAYFPSVDLNTIQSAFDTIWLADYRTNYDRTIPRDMHQYTSSGSVNGISGRVDLNTLYRDFPNEKEEQELTFVETNEFEYVCTSTTNPKCETFSAPDVNASLGSLVKGNVYPVTAVSKEEITVGDLWGYWLKVIDDNGDEVYVLDIDDGRGYTRAVVEPEEPAPSPSETNTLIKILRQCAEYFLSITEDYQ